MQTGKGRALAAQTKKVSQTKKVNKNTYFIFSKKVRPSRASLSTYSRGPPLVG